MVFLAAGHDVTGLIQQWISAGGPFILFSILFVCGLGLPLPEDIPLITAGALIAAERMDPFWGCVAGWCGIMGGDLLLYHLGRKFGLEITRVPFVGKHLTRKRIEHVEKLFDKYGIWVVAVGRMFAGVRGAMVAAAGAIRYNRVKFFIADGLAAIVSGGLFVGLGYWLGSKLPELIREVDKIKTWMTIGLGALVMAGIGWFFWRKKRGARILHEDEDEDDASAAAQPTDPPNSDNP